MSKRHSHRLAGAQVSTAAVRIPLTLSCENGSTVKGKADVMRPAEWPAHAKWDHRRMMRAIRRGITVRVQPVGKVETTWSTASDESDGARVNFEDDPVPAEAGQFADGPDLVFELPGYIQK